jgi:hypothetical protein
MGRDRRAFTGQAFVKAHRGLPLLNVPYVPHVYPLGDIWYQFLFFSISLVGLFGTYAVPLTESV